MRRGGETGQCVVFIRAGPQADMEMPPFPAKDDTQTTQQGKKVKRRFSGRLYAVEKRTVIWVRSSTQIVAPDPRSSRLILGFD